MPSGGTRITQAPGGGANIDLSWGGAPGQAQPPRMPGGTPTGSSAGSYRQQAPAGSGAGSAFAAPWGRDDDNLPSRQPRGRREACPFDTDGGVAPGAPQRAARQQPSSPFATDA